MTGALKSHIVWPIFPETGVGAGVQTRKNNDLLGILVTLSLLLSLFGSLLFVVLYGLNASTQAEGVALALAAFGLSIGLMTWAKYLLPPETAVDEREQLPSPEPEREAAFAAWSVGAEAVVSRRAWLTRLLGAERRSVCGEERAASRGACRGRAAGQSILRVGRCIASAD